MSVVSMPTPSEIGSRAGMITATLAELVDAELALTSLSELKVRPALAYHLATLLRLVKVETAQFHTQREAMIRELGVPKGDQVEVPADQREEFVRRITELVNVQVAVAAKPVSLTDLPDLTAADVLRLGPFVTA